jgi:predicted amidohydrolase YtcJ
MDWGILSARVFTGDPERPLAEAVGIKGNRIAAVGSNEEVRSSCRGTAQLLELPGRLVTPGLVDGHCHFVSLGSTLQMVNLRNLPSLAACRERIRQGSASRRPGEWIIGRGWNQHQWDERREPTCHDLDDLVPHSPAMMVRVCGHSVWVNAMALVEAGITRETPDPPGGRIERDPISGDPTGLLHEARHLIEEVIPPPTLEESKRAALAAQQEALRVGLTGVHSPEGLQPWEALTSLDAEGKLKLRVHHLVLSDELEEAVSRGIAPGQGSERLWFGQVKLFADGSLGAGTALLHEPYSDDPSQRGIAYTEPELLREKIQLAYERGWDVAIHAIGDRGVTNALEAIAAARKVHPGAKRDRIEHVQLFRPQDLSLFRDLNVVASVQPAFVPTDWQVAERRWGRDRLRYAYAWKSLLEARIPMQFGSDAPVESINPLLGLQAAVTRQTPRGEPAGGWRPEERLDLEEGIRAYTLPSSWTSGKEHHLGTIAPGRWADLSVFQEDLFRLGPEQWPSVEAEMTVVHGEVVYRAAG